MKENIIFKNKTNRNSQKCCAKLQNTIIIKRKKRRKKMQFFLLMNLFLFLIWTFEKKQIYQVYIWSTANGHFHKGEWTCIAEQCLMFMLYYYYNNVYIMVQYRYRHNILVYMCNYSIYSICTITFISSLILYNVID